MFLAPAEGQVLDTWHTGGLRGTGGHDFEMKGASVPAIRSVWFADPPVCRRNLHMTHRGYPYGAAGSDRITASDHREGFLK